MSSSDEESRSLETEHINRTLRANNYPKSFINRTRRKMRAGHARAENGPEEGRKLVVVLQYVRGVTEKITRILHYTRRLPTNQDKI